MFKKVFEFGVVLSFGMFSMLVSRDCLAWDIPGNIFTPAYAVSDTTTAQGFTLVPGSTQQQIDVRGKKFTSTGFQIFATDVNGTTVDFLYAFSSNPSVYNRWYAIWGPLQRLTVLPSSGLFVAPAFTTSGTIYIYFETIQ